MIFQFCFVYHCFREGRHLTDDEIAGMLIGLLLAGQHTSSTTTSWLAFFLAEHKEIQVSLYIMICVYCVLQLDTVLKVCQALDQCCLFS